MDLSPIKLEVLEALLLHDQPVKAAVIAKEVGREAKVVQMHLIGLTRAGLAETPEKGQYLISVLGKKTLGLPEVTRQKALEILSQTPRDKAFHFYAGVGKPLNVYAYDLLDFCSKLDAVSLEAISFHLGRGDFEAWFKMLGDVELVKKVALLKKMKLTGESLRIALRIMLECRCLTLSKMVGETTHN